MAATAAQIQALAQLQKEFRAVFGEDIPYMQLLGRDPDDQIRVVRECIEQRSTAPIERLMPPGSFT